MFVLEKLGATYTGEETYRPKGITAGKTYRVIGVAERTRMRSFDGKEKEHTDVFLYVINEESKITRIIDSNCSVSIAK